VVAMTVVDITGSLFTMTVNGFGKRSPIDEYRMTHRGSKGVRTIVTNERNGKVVFVSQVSDENELLITTEQGMTVRIPVRDIREQGRNTMGVRIMRLNEGDNVVSVTQVLAESDKEEEGETEAIESMPLGITEEQQDEEDQTDEQTITASRPPIDEQTVVLSEPVTMAEPITAPGDTKRLKPKKIIKKKDMKNRKIRSIPAAKKKKKQQKKPKKSSPKKKPLQKTKKKPVRQKKLKKTPKKIKQKKKPMRKR
jgi:hypothetical protein